jgi:hypothetical protein
MRHFLAELLLSGTLDIDRQGQLGISRFQRQFWQTIYVSGQKCGALLRQQVSFIERKVPVSRSAA